MYMILRVTLFVFLLVWKSSPKQTIFSSSPRFESVVNVIMHLSYVHMYIVQCTFCISTKTIDPKNCSLDLFYIYLSKRFILQINMFNLLLLQNESSLLFYCFISKLLLLSIVKLRSRSRSQVRSRSGPGQVQVRSQVRSKRSKD